MRSLIDTYREYLQPNSLLDIMPQELLVALLKGFHYQERSGVALLYDTLDRPGILQRLDLFAKDDPRLSEHYNPFCAFYRKRPENDAKCEECDLHVARYAYRQILTDIHVYTCHMALTDMIFPVRIGGEVRGVLFSGQMIPRMTPQPDAPTPVVERKVHERAAPDMHAELVAIAFASAMSDAEISRRIDGFQIFGKALQGAFDLLYAARRDAAARALVAEATQRLTASADEGSEANWWDTVHGVLDEIAGLVRDCPIVVMVRRRSRYVVKAATASARQVIRAQDEQHPSVVPAGPFHSVPEDRLASPGEIEGSTRMVDALAERFGEAFRTCTLMRHDLNSLSQIPISTIVVVGGAIPEEWRATVEACSGTICQKTNAVHLVEVLRNQQSDLSKRVSFTAHWLKTPLQNVMFTLHSLEPLSMTGDPADAERKRRFLKASRELAKVRFDAMTLQSVAVEHAERVDLAPFLKEIAAAFEDMASARSVKIEFAEDKRFDYWVRATKDKLQVALSNLIDNAVKYSYEQKSVDIRLSAPTRDRVMIRILNFGVGFDAEARNRIFRIGGRAAVVDPRRRRPGAGLGLPHALALIEEAGGSLDIDSRPADANSRQPGLRYVTTAYVSLPRVPASERALPKEASKS